MRAAVGNTRYRLVALRICFLLLQPPDPIPFNAEISDFVALFYANEALSGVAQILVIRLYDKLSPQVGETIEAADSHFGKAILKLLDLVVFRRNNLDALLVDDSPPPLYLHNGYTVAKLAGFFIKAIVKASLVGDVVKLVTLVSHQPSAIREVE